MSTQKLTNKTDIEYLIYDNARLVDDDLLEDWVTLFTDDSEYRVVTRNNFDRNLPLSMIHCTGRAMLSDRILSLREANIYNPHTDRHIVSNIRVLSEGPGGVEVHSTFIVVQTDIEGYSKLYCSGKYLDTIVSSVDGLRFSRRLVVVDNWAIDNLLATPL